jgi:hypothetical protein
MTFRDRLAEAQRRNQSTLAVGFAPVLKKMPYSLQRYDDPLLPYGKAMIDATADTACAYVFHLSAYLAYGASGAIALERTLAYVPPPIIKIFHGPFASGEYARAAFEDAFAADAVTLIPTVEADLITAYTQQLDHAAFVRADSAPDSLIAALHTLAVRCPGQVGIYRQLTPGHAVLNLLDEPVVEMHWYSVEALCTAQGDDFREALHDTATRMRQRLTLRTEL